MIGNRLYELRKKHQLTQDQLAEALNVTRQTISNWENDNSSPDINQSIELATLFGLSLDELATGVKVKEQSNTNKRTLLILILILLFIGAPFLLIIVPFLFYGVSEVTYSSSTSTELICVVDDKTYMYDVIEMDNDGEKTLSIEGDNDFVGEINLTDTSFDQVISDIKNNVNEQNGYCE